MVIVTVKYQASAEEVANKREEHIAFLMDLHKCGVLVNAGRKAEGGGVIILNAKDEVEAEQIMDADPYYCAGLSLYEYAAFQERF